MGFSSKTATQVFGLYADTHHNRSSRIEGVVLAFLNPESKDKRVQRSMNNQEHSVAVERGEEAVGMLRVAGHGPQNYT